MASSGGVGAGFEPRHLGTSPPLSAGTSPEPPPMDGHGMKPPPPPPPHPPPHRLLPPDFRNGDFLHRLLAATPPYLYSMPLLPHSFFFSDMLKSFVTGKPPVPPGDGTPPPNPSTPPKEQQQQSMSGMPAPPLDLMNPVNKDMLLMPSRPPHRRRKRSWRDLGEPPRKISASPINMSVIPDKPLELTTTNRSSSSEEKSPRPPSSPAMRSTPDPPATTPVSTPPPLPPRPLLLPGLHHCGMLPPGLSDGIPPPSELLPALLPGPTAPFPPPPLWFPSLYPGLPPPPPPPPPPPQTPFGGIDPLHFFIDLRVSGHIWDRKQNASLRGGGDKGGDDEGSEGGDQGSRRALEDGQISPGSSTSSDPNSFHGGVHQNKHCSAFTVPEARERRRLGLAQEENIRKEHGCRTAPTANYVLQNLSRIYREVQGRREASAAASASTAATSAASAAAVAAVVTKEEVRDEEDPEARREGVEEVKRESGEESEAPVKDLPALIGLELVVDYVKHDGKGGRKGSNSSSSATSGPPEVAEVGEEVIDP